MTKRFSSKRCRDAVYNAQTGALFGTALGSLHMVHHALTNHVPEDIYTHVLRDLAVGALGSAVLFAAVSVICTWFSQTS